MVRAIFLARASAGDTYHGRVIGVPAGFVLAFLMAVGGEEKGGGPGRLQEGGSRAHGPCGILISLQQFVLKTLLCQGGTGPLCWRICP